MIAYDLRKIRAAVFDIDGVLSAETITMNAEGHPLRTVNIKDGYAIQLAMRVGLRVAIMTGGTSEAVFRRYNGLGVEDIVMGCRRKIEAYTSFLSTYGLHDEEVLYMGDDIPDIEIMRRVGCPCCPRDACGDVKEVSIYVSPRDGGHGCGRDVIEQVLRAQGLWLRDEQAFGW